MFKQWTIAALLAVMVSAAPALARGPARVDRVGAFGKGGPPAVRAQVGSATTKATEKYACPMKCVTSDKPGKCPKCGMDMKKVEPAKGKHDAPKHEAPKHDAH